MLEQSTSQLESGGSIPTSPLQYRIGKCKFKDISPILEEFHYKKKHIGGNIELCLCLTYNDEIIGGAVLGRTRHDNKYSKNGKIKVWEIRRLCCIDDTAPNTESYFIGKIVWYLRKNTAVDALISYADKTVNHIGTIYKASNFELIGKTPKSNYVLWNDKRYHMRSLTIDRPYSYMLREEIKTGSARIIKGDIKLIYWFWLKKYQNKD